MPWSVIRLLGSIAPTTAAMTMMTKTHPPTAAITIHDAFDVALEVARAVDTYQFNYKIIYVGPLDLKLNNHFILLIPLELFKRRNLYRSEAGFLRRNKSDAIRLNLDSCDTEDCTPKVDVIT
uniref:Cystatin domain-containing protein n=1 Tax=Panagrellus redivivus TaxID=6233 RepID=A0A7E4VN32_PANRE